MTEPFFFERGPGLSVREIAVLTGAEPRSGADLDWRITGVASLESAAPCDLAFLDRPKYTGHLSASGAGACLTTERYAGRAPEHISVLCVREPYRAFVEVARTLFPDALRPSSLFEANGVAVGACVHPTARMESGVTVDPGAVIGPRAEIGSGTVIGANAVIGPKVRIGRQCVIGANASITNSLLGDRVIIHPGCAIGQDGFGYLMGATGHTKVPQIGRVIIQDDVEIGALSAVDRGAFRDTVIGEGTKIDNLVQVGHNVQIGRHCVLAGKAGISGSVILEDFAVLGAAAAVVEHVRIGEGGQIAAAGIVYNDVPAGGRMAGIRAKPIQQWLRELATLERLAGRDRRSTAHRDDE
jgi:UDP-3-O-[3-hydroxymyristoyl] glucosamine N-acyltransferase